MRKLVLSLFFVLQLFSAGNVLAGSIISWGHSVADSGELLGDPFLAIAAGWRHGLALKFDGSIVGWGYDYFGQASPPAGNDYVAIAAGWNYSIALKSDGSVVGWSRFCCRFCCRSK